MATQGTAAMRPAACRGGCGRAVGDYIGEADCAPAATQHLP